MQPSDSQPLAIKPSEWKEIAALPLIRDMWGLGDDGTYEDLAAEVYGVKFDFLSGSPGYCGDLFILQGSHLTGDPPVMLIRENGKLTFADET